MTDESLLPEISSLAIRDSPARAGDSASSPPDLDVSVALDHAEAVVRKWENGTGEQMVWEISSEDAQDYLLAVDSLQALLGDGDGGPDAARIQEVLRIAQGRLKSEFKHLLAIHTECVDPSWLPESFSAPSFSSNPDPSDEDGSSTNPDGVSTEQQSMREQSFIIDLLPPAIVADLSDIARRMANMDHSRDCIDAYILVRKGVLEDSMFLLGVERLSSEDVQKMEWKVLEPRMKKCLKAMKVSFKVLFASERFLSDEVFAVDLEESDTCFAEMANDAALEVLDMIRVFATPDKPEKLFRLLDMYETLKELLPEIELAFQGQVCSRVRQEAADVLDILSGAARETFVGVKNAIETSLSTQPVVNGAVHPLTRYLMNYLSFLSEYMDTMKELFGHQESANGEAGVAGGDETSEAAGAGEDENEVGALRSPLVPVLMEILEALMRHTDENARLYRDTVLSTIFLMNNTHYIVQKAKHAGIQFVIGDSWLRRHSSLVRYHAMNYQRVAWGKIFSYLRDEGIRGPGYNISKEILKERFKNFNAAFEEIHRTQAGWVVSDGLRDELRVLISDKLIPAYRSFLGRYRVHLEGMRHSERYLKYSVEDLENLINNLFVGAAHGSMSRRRSITGGG
ncbi:hypothetical protein SELMODRAFT_171149 [Selaginella moellendorffii]|uniref:Exocyst subunit Exo70 family protein n=1 Tax=Selaginella moellendorffii TaxID=88036 RepID=D8RFZ1_SELML|nr:exocyst complex component EXO70A1 [Selaginella moellendorffii]EFJ28947.1 hypothetical protein SELMODRAFT_171149 [Selaginella moellendorffii]|eukprot:XP_002969823.1 exocyst complex component EXO70A1 [Selaginella moellendorffii]